MAKRRNFTPEKRNLFSKSSAVRLPKQKCVGVIISTKINSHSGSDSKMLLFESTDKSCREAYRSP